MKYLSLLFTVLALWSTTTANGQGFQAGVNAGYLLHLQPGANGPGTGVQGGVWASWLVAKKSRLQLSLGHRRLGGFSRLDLETSVTNTENETLRTVSAKQLMGLHFIDAELGWAFQSNPESPWSYYAGAYYAHIIGWQVFNRTITATERTGRNGFFGLSAPPWVVRDELSSGDFGLRLGISYRILKGFSAQFHIRKGLPGLVTGSRFADSPKDHLTAFSLGLSARLF